MGIALSEIDPAIKKNVLLEYYDTIRNIRPVEYPNLQRENRFLLPSTVMLSV